MSDVVVITVASGTPEPKRWVWPTSTTSLSTPSSPGREPDGVPGSPLTPPVACHAGAQSCGRYRGVPRTKKSSRVTG
ncbi:unnamed protein product [Arctogadus glacialis]